MTIEEHIRSKTTILLTNAFITWSIEQLSSSIDISLLSTEIKAEAVFAYFLTLPLANSVTQPEWIKELIFEKPNLKVWSANAQPGSYSSGASSNARPALLNGLLSSRKVNETTRQSAHDLRVPVRSFVCEVVYHTYRDIIQETVYSHACPLVQAATTRFRLLLGVLITKNGVSDQQAERAQIKSRLLLPGAKILVIAGYFRQCFIEAIDYRLLGGYAVSLINSCLKEHNEQLKAFQISSINKQVENMLERDANFEDIKRLWAAPRITLQFEHFGLNEVFV